MTRTIDTIGRAARHDMLLKVECRSCDHVGFHKALDVARIIGHGRAIDSIRFVCSQCKRTGARATPIEFDRDRPPKVMVWVPMRLRR